MRKKYVTEERLRKIMGSGFVLLLLTAIAILSGIGVWNMPTGETLYNLGWIAQFGAITLSFLLAASIIGILLAAVIFMYHVHNDWDVEDE